MFFALIVCIVLCTIFTTIAGFFTAKFKMHPFISTMANMLVIFGLVTYSTKGVSFGGIDSTRLNSLIERIERLEEEKKGISSDIRDIYAEAKGVGFDVKIMKAIIKLRKMNQADRDEQEFLLKLDALSDHAHSDQCTMANPRYPLVSEIKEIYRKRIDDA